MNIVKPNGNMVYSEFLNKLNSGTCSLANNIALNKNWHVVMDARVDHPANFRNFHFNVHDPTILKTKKQILLTCCMLFEDLLQFTICFTINCFMLL